jgi:ribosomal protein L13
VFDCLTVISFFDILNVRVLAKIQYRADYYEYLFSERKGFGENRKWFVVDAQGKTVGRLATEVARMLSGKNNPAYTPFLDMGDHVVVINARHAIFTGSKNEQKVYRYHTLYPGGLRETNVKDMFANKPERFWNWRLKECFRKPSSVKQWRKN